jgi:hypothetical protein
MGVGKHLKMWKDWALSFEWRRGPEPQGWVSGYVALRLGRIR